MLCVWIDEVKKVTMIKTNKSYEKSYKDLIKLEQLMHRETNIQSFMLIYKEEHDNTLIIFHHMVFYRERIESK